MTVTALWTNPTQVIRKQDSETEIEIFSDPRDWGHEQARYILFRSVTAKILQNRLAQPLNYEAYVSSWGCFIEKPQHKVVLTDLFYPGKCLPIKAIFRNLRSSTCNLATKMKPPLLRENHSYHNYFLLAGFSGWRLYEVKKIRRVYPAWRQAGFARTREISITIPIAK